MQLRFSHTFVFVFVSVSVSISVSVSVSEFITEMHNVHHTIFPIDIVTLINDHAT